jgi:hypothetical protein
VNGASQWKKIRLVIWSDWGHKLEGERRNKRVFDIIMHSMIEKIGWNFIQLDKYS